MNIIEAMQNILLRFPKIAEVCSVIHVEFPSDTPDSYGLSPTGDVLLSEDILGNQKRQHSFILYSTFSGINDYERFVNSSTLLELAQWLEQQEGTAIDGGEIVNIRAENGMLSEILGEDSQSGFRYMMQIAVTYTAER